MALQCVASRRRAVPCIPASRNKLATSGRQPLVDFDRFDMRILFERSRHSVRIGLRRKFYDMHIDLLDDGHPTCAMSAEDLVQLLERQTRARLHEEPGWLGSSDRHAASQCPSGQNTRDGHASRGKDVTLQSSRRRYSLVKIWSGNSRSLRSE